MLEGILGTAFGRLNGSLGGGFLPRVLLFYISTLDWIRSFNRLVFVPLCISFESLNERMVPCGAGEIASEAKRLRASNVRGFA